MDVDSLAGAKVVRTDVSECLDYVVYLPVDMDALPCVVANCNSAERDHLHSTDNQFAEWLMHRLVGLDTTHRLAIRQTLRNLAELYHRSGGTGQSNACWPRVATSAADMVDNRILRNGLVVVDPVR